MKLRRLSLRVVVPAVALLAVIAFGLLGEHRLSSPLPPATVSLAVPSSLIPLQGQPPAVEVPAQGSLALVADHGGTLASRDAEAIRPIASVAKAMTALAVLDAHPLRLGEEGPQLTLSDSDVAIYRRTVSADGSAVPVVAGEKLTEHQVLLAMLLPSANNLAETLARWVDGDEGAFVARLNRKAAALGMIRTRFADVSGFDPLTVSTADDLILLGRAVLAVPALAAIVDTPAATLPDGTQLRSTDALLTTEPGWLGIKTGSTPQAGGCLLFAARRAPGAGTREVTVVGAILGQVDRPAALQAARRAVESAYRGYVAVDPRGISLDLRGSATTPWGESSPLALAAAESGSIALRPGESVVLTSISRATPSPVPSGAQVGTVEMRSGELLLERWSVVTRSEVPGPSWWWRLLHG